MEVLGGRGAGRIADVPKSICCKTCTDDILNKGQNLKKKLVACIQIGAVEFGGVCGMCDARYLSIYTYVPTEQTNEESE